MAFAIPLLLDCDCFVKKETVNGIIGKTHGVNNAKRPPAKPKKKILNKLLSSELLVVSFNRAVFFRFSFNLLDSNLLLSSKTTTCFLRTEPFKEKAYMSSN